jgi:hypothetical protein
MLVVFTLAALCEFSADALASLGLPAALALVGCSAGLLTYGIIVNQCPLSFDRIIGAYVAIAFVTCRGANMAFLHFAPDWAAAIVGLTVFCGGMILVL